MKNEIVKIDAPELQGIEKSKAQQIRKTFEPMVEMLEGFEDAFNKIISEKKITKEVTTRAKRLRIDISKVRIETEKTRKAQKEEYLRAGKAIDGVSNILKWAVIDKENKLKEIERYFEIQEQKRLEALQKERAEKLSPYVEDAHERDLSKMDEDVWNAYFTAKKKAYEDEQEAIKKAEQERIKKEKEDKLHFERKENLINRNLWQFRDEALEHEHLGKTTDKQFAAIVKKLSQRKAEYEKEQERIRLENERLKKEAEKRAKIEKERQIKLEQERKERESKERKQREAYEAKLKAEREAKLKLEAELAAKKEAEEKAKREAEAKLQAELNKGDKEKINNLIADLEALKTKYAFKAAKNKKMYESVKVLIGKTILFIETH